MSGQLFLDAPGGDSIEYIIIDEESGYRLCTFGFTREQLLANIKNLKDIKCRDDDFLLCSYPKTGTNWLWEMLSMALLKTNRVTGTTKGPGMIEAVLPQITESLPSPRLLNSHLLVKYFPREVTEKRLKMVLLLRNPKDVAVSFYNHTRGIKLYKYEGKFENYLNMFMRGEVDCGSYPEYLRQWQKFIQDNPDYPLLVMYYEDIFIDCLAELKKVCKFLEVDADDTLLHQIVAKCQIDTLRKEKAENILPEVLEQLKHVMRENFSLYRKGQVGGWKNWFTVAQNEVFDQWWQTETKGITMFSFRYT